MKYELKAKQAFVDKYTGHVYSIDESFEVDEKRGKELTEDPRGLVELVKEIEEEKAEEPAEEEKAEESAEEKPKKKTTRRKTATKKAAE